MNNNNKSILIEQKYQNIQENDWNITAWQFYKKKQNISSTNVKSEVPEDIFNSSHFQSF